MDHPPLSHLFKRLLSFINVTTMRYLFCCHQHVVCYYVTAHTYFRLPRRRLCFLSKLRLPLSFSLRLTAYPLRKKSRRRLGTPVCAKKKTTSGKKDVFFWPCSSLPDFYILEMSRTKVWKLCVIESFSKNMVPWHLRCLLAECILCVRKLILVHFFHKNPRMKWLNESQGVVIWHWNKNAFPQNNYFQYFQEEFYCVHRKKEIAQKMFSWLVVKS